MNHDQYAFDMAKGNFSHKKEVKKPKKNKDKKKYCVYGICV